MSTELQPAIPYLDRAIEKFLPSNVDQDAFKETAIIAAKMNPDLLEADQRSLNHAVASAAVDGLLPDGKEGIINVFNTKIEPKNADPYWVKKCQWIPMVYGIRKRAMELGGMIISANVVYANDTFEWHQGDTPKIVHTPAPLNEESGEMIGAYAIFKVGDEIVHREVMRKIDILKVKSCSKAQKGILWNKFETEAWKKTVIRRGIKTVPAIKKELAEIIQRDDELYVFDDKQTIEAAPTQRLTPPPPPPIPVEEVSQEEPVFDQGEFLAQVESQMEKAKTLEELEVILEAASIDDETESRVQEMYDLYETKFHDQGPSQMDLEDVIAEVA